MNKTKRRVGIYLRVSTSGQTTENQRRDLKAWVSRSGHELAAVFEDAGISGAKTREQRPGLDAVLKAAARREIDVLAVWSVDRLGRSLPDLLSTLQALHAVGCDLFIHQQALDTCTPAGKALFGMLGVFSEFERAMIRERVQAGLARARQQGRVGGRPRVNEDMEQAIREELGKGVGTSTVQRIKSELSA
ncbi:MAG: recombinase family protein [Deltaproteobacteria bacterium]|nr:recombinase family protein [Deltaproteobacteria bacterium]